MNSIPDRVSIDDVYLTRYDLATIERYRAEIQAEYEEEITVDMVMRRLLSNALMAKAVEYRIRDIKNGERHAA